MSYFFLKKKLYCLGIDLTQSPLLWVVLCKDNQKINLVRHNDSATMPTNKIPHCQQIYTSISDQHVMTKSIPFRQSLSDEQIMLQLQLSAQNLFALPWEALAIDFYSLQQQVTVAAVRQTIITQIVQQLSLYQLHATAIEPTKQTLNRLTHFYPFDKNINLLVHTEPNSFQILRIEHNEIEYYHHAKWDNPNNNENRSIQLKQIIENSDNYLANKITISGLLALPIAPLLAQSVRIPVNILNPFTPFQHNTINNPSKFTLAFGLALGGIIKDD